MRRCNLTAIPVTTVSQMRTLSYIHLYCPRNNLGNITDPPVSNIVTEIDTKINAINTLGDLSSVGICISSTNNHSGSYVKMESLQNDKNDMILKGMSLLQKASHFLKNPTL